MLREDEASLLLMFRPYILACQSKSPRIMEVGLDSLRKLILNGYVRGTVRANLYNPADTNAEQKYLCCPPELLLTFLCYDERRPHLDVLVHVVCTCFDPEADDGVRSRIVKVLCSPTQICRCSYCLVSWLLAYCCDRKLFAAGSAARGHAASQPGAQRSTQERFHHLFQCARLFAKPRNSGSLSNWILMCFTACTVSSNILCAVL